MVKFFYAMHEELVKKYAETKSEIITARNDMNAASIQAYKSEVMQECRVFDFDPDNTSNLYSVKNGVATIPIAGMLVQKVDFCSAFFGETLTTYQFIREAVAKAENDSSVMSIDFDINSGGGVVSGVDETSQAIRATNKPTMAIVRDMAASAAYWLASATDEIVISSNAAFIGSIGVAVEILNRDEADKKNGTKRTVLTNTTSKDKRPNLMTEEGQAVLVDELNAIFDVFAESILVKRSDRISREEIENLSGKVVIASEAVKMGLADKMMTIEGSGDIVVNSSNADAPQIADVNKNLEADMNLTEYLDQNPSAKAEHDTIIRTANAEAVKNAMVEDRERSSKIAKLYGNNKMAIDAINNGTSVGDLAVAEKEKAIELATAETQDLGKVVVQNQVPEKPEVSKETTQQKEAQASVAEFLNKGVKK